MPIPRRMARFNRVVTNRITGPFADRLPGFGVLHHVGRRSGAHYAMPINCFPDGNDYILVLTYGVNTDWLKNVLAAGGCELVTRGQRIRLTNPRIENDTDRRWAPALARPLLRRVFDRMQINQVARLTRVA